MKVFKPWSVLIPTYRHIHLLPMFAYSFTQQLVSFTSPVPSLILKPNQFYHAQPHPQLFAPLLTSGSAREKQLKSFLIQRGSQCKKYQDMRFFYSFFVLYFVQPPRKKPPPSRRQCTGSGSKSMDAPNSPCHFSGQDQNVVKTATSLWLSFETIWTEADNYEAEWMHRSYTTVSSTSLAINQFFFSTLNRVSKDHKSSSLNHKLNAVVPLAYTFPSQTKGIIILVWQSLQRLCALAPAL